MSTKNANIDFCGIRTLLRSLEQTGFSKSEIAKISARIAASLRADIILFFCHFNPPPRINITKIGAARFG